MFEIGPHCGKHASAVAWPTARSRPIPRSARATCARSRRRSSRSSRARPTPRASCGRTRSTWGWTGSCSSTSSTPATTIRAASSISPSPRARARGPSNAGRRRESHLVMIVLAAIVAVTSMIFLVRSSAGRTRPRRSRPPPPRSSTPRRRRPRRRRPGRSTNRAPSTKTARQRAFTVVLTGCALASSWVGIARSTKTVLSTHGTDLTAYTIDPAIDSTVTFVVAVPVKMQVGAPGNLTSRSTARPAPLPTGTSHRSA